MIFQLPTWGVGSWGSGLLSAYLLIKKWLSQLKSYSLIKKNKKIKMLLEQVVLKKKKFMFLRINQVPNSRIGIISELFSRLVFQT